MEKKSSIKKYLRIAIPLTILAILVAAGIFVYSNRESIYYTFVSSIDDKPLSETADVYEDLFYCGTDDKNQTLDLVVPKERPFGATPLIIYIHGGGWSEGGKENTITDEYAAGMSNLGMAGASIDYRLSNEAVYPAQNEDITCAIDFLFANADKYHFDTENIILVGDSAGGQLAAIEVFSQKHEYKGLIMAYGVSDIWRQITVSHDINAEKYIGTKAKEVAEKASPAFANTHPDTSFLLLHGTEDAIVPAEESKEFAEKLRKEGIKVTYVTFEKAGHAFLGTGNEADKKAALVILEWIANLVQ